MRKVNLDGRAYACATGETVLDALLRQGVDVAYSCRRGTCHSCLLRAEAGRVPETAQAGLRDSLRSQGYFLACQCRPREDMALVRPEDGGLFRRATVMEREDLAPGIAALRLALPDGFTYSSGQFVNLRRPDGLVRSYSLTAPASRKDHLELHIARQAGGRMSNWLLDCLLPGDEIELAGPNGDCVHVPGNHAQPILMIGTGTGLAPLLGVVLDALDAGHSGPIRLYHGSSRITAAAGRKACIAASDSPKSPVVTPILPISPAYRAARPGRESGRGGPTVSPFPTIPILPAGDYISAAGPRWFTRRGKPRSSRAPALTESPGTRSRRPLCPIPPIRMPRCDVPEQRRQVL